MTVHTEILLIAIAVSIACAIPGVFLVLRRMSMMADAITHTVFLGIVLAFFMTEDLNSPFLLVGATLVGVGTCQARFAAVVHIYAQPSGY